MPLQPSRTVAELRELQELTGDENGAQRVAWTDTWARAREWLEDKLGGLPLELAEDEAANQWGTLRGASEPAATVRLVNWADEEGARFGRSLFGSSAASGSMDDQGELRQRRDADGVALPDAIRARGVDLDRALEA